MIYLRGIQTHNLKNIDLEIPLGALVCITGVSGSGKSSLAFDTLGQEARRRYFEVLRRTETHLPPMPAPPVREAHGLPPAVVLEQKIPRLSWRSTVGTFTRVLDFLRVLFAELGRVVCPECGQKTRPLSFAHILEELQALPEGSKLFVLAPLKRPNQETLRYLLGEGFSRFLFDDQIFDLTEEAPPKDIKQAFVLIDRLVINERCWFRLEEALRLASQLAGGVVRIRLLEKKDLIFTTEWRCPFCGKELDELSPEHFSFNHPLGACPKCKGLGKIEGEICPQCQGQRLSARASLVRLAGKTFSALGQSPLEELFSWLEELNFQGLEEKIFQGLKREIVERIKPLLDFGLGYLSLFHPGPLLSTGELQKIRIASLLGERLSGCLYVLDEPTLALPPEEKKHLLFFLRRLQAQGNTIVMVEHDPLLISAADFIVELGPGAGHQGGKIIFLGTPEELVRQTDTPTGAYLSGRQKIQRPERKISLKSTGREQIPDGALTVLCGPTGSGKSIFLQNLLKSHRNACLVTPAEGKGRESFVISFVGAFKALREFLAETKEARLLGLSPAHFSPFTQQGRCPGCKGKGKKSVKIPLLPPLDITCEECQGTGLTREALRVRYRGYNLYELLQMTVEEALPLLGKHPLLKARLSLLEEVGLGYLRLGQDIASLSGGERQRLRLIRFLISPQDRLLLFDLPTLGLHLADVARLLRLFDRLLEQGQTVVVADNHPVLVLLADHLIEIQKGETVWAGPPTKWLETRPFAKGYERYKSLVKRLKN